MEMEFQDVSTTPPIKDHQSYTRNGQGKPTHHTSQPNSSVKQGHRWTRKEGIMKLQISNWNASLFGELNTSRVGTLSTSMCKILQDTKGQSRESSKTHTEVPVNNSTYRRKETTKI
eukprot:2262269-Ditylum_brightwellii.AAC.1